MNSDLTINQMEKALGMQDSGLSYKELRNEFKKYRKKDIEKKIKASGYLSSDELLSFLKDKGATLDPDTKNIVRFAKKNNIKIKRFGRIGSFGSNPAFFERPNTEKVKEIIQKLKNNNNSVPGKKALDNKKREILKIFNQAADKEESKTSIAKKVTSNLMVNTNRKLVRKVLDKEKSKSDINKKLIKKVY